MSDGGAVLIKRPGRPAMIVVSREDAQGRLLDDAWRPAPTDVVDGRPVAEWPDGTHRLKTMPERPKER